ncbi:hypothetical protein BDQ17DRAFT_1256613, partial [Cyathus striatus]
FKNFSYIAIIMALVVCAICEKHTVIFTNNCGYGQPHLIQGPNTLSYGEPYTSDGPFNQSLYLYLQTEDNGQPCNFNGEGCTLMEMTLRNADCPGCALVLIFLL